MTKVTNEYPYVGLKTLVWKTKKSSPKPEPRMFSNDGVFVGTSEDVHELKEELESLKDDWNMCDKACDELELENRKLKKLLKESIENFKTKELADRIYNIPGIERPVPEPMKPKVDGEIPF
tara:strand:+ start:233 stop:595 length:363 start_codon:yes stop_codon:yes gene_type:complete